MLVLNGNGVDSLTDRQTETPIVGAVLIRRAIDG